MRVLTDRKEVKHEQTLVVTTRRQVKFRLLWRRRRRRARARAHALTHLRNEAARSLAFLAHTALSPVCAAVTATERDLLGQEEKTCIKVRRAELSILQSNACARARADGALTSRARIAPICAFYEHTNARLSRYQRWARAPIERLLSACTNKRR